MDDGSGKVDLTRLGNSDNTPKFKDVLYSDEGYYYSYNPCGGFDEGACSNAAVCVSNQDKSEQQQIGDASRAAFKWDDDSNNVIAAYTSGKGVLRLSTVNLICDPNACTPTFQPEGEQGAGQFEMTLTTVCACPGKCGPNGPTSCSGSGSSGLSGGSILLIAFFTLVVIYFVAGILYMKFKNQATGTDLIPNKSLWTSIPRNVVNGNKFVISKITRKPTTYDQI
ncbi:cation-dependent mannose-6-phosphate receptor-like isoform X2 [Ruditapes philippinarum]|uniref:cation-dependent mannose-6-phosphate receptor-like isoform X2 n=1 Tax=Ruditapes philippinarum TaxID=129788 RepID=UPI00295B1EB3|nr:cation-dependent mannose-6-phosphate receptor-like isoform X2 [Ruditapes philippinarum]